MSTRARTVWVGGVSSVVLLVTCSAVPVPYVALGPGSAFNVIGQAQGHQVITFTGEDIPAAAAEQPSGRLDMLTVTIISEIPMLVAVALWATGTHDMAPREEYFPPGKSVEEVNQQNAQMFIDSQSNAEIEALRYLGYPNVVYVGDIPANSPSAGILQPQDQITAVDGKPVTDYNSLRSVMSTTKPGQVVTVTVLRNGESVDEKVTLGSNPSVGTQGVLGVNVAERPVAPFDIHIALSDIGGPSAGLMFTLGIIDRLTPGSLSGGKNIAGTGTMNLDGTVGAIGGVRQKEITARRAGANVFLIPAANCAEGLTSVPRGLELVKVSTLDDAMAAVTSLSKGGTPPGC
jgi:PDZ domain-containing protein